MNASAVGDSAVIVDVPDRLRRRVAGFQAFLRAHGFQAGIPEAMDALKLAHCVDITDRRRLRAGLQSLFCSGQGDWRRFDELFDAYWLPPNRSVLRESRAAGDGPGRTADQENRPPRGLLSDVRQGGGDAARVAGDDAAQGGASSAESLERRDFRLLMRDDDLEAVEHLVDRLARQMRRRMIRRQQIAAAGRRLHLRRTLRNSLQFGGTPLELSYRRRRRKPPQLVMLLDVSRSMSVYTYMLLRFTRAIVCGFKRADAFVFHTQLVAVTDALKERNPERMRDRLMLLSAGWSGGTRIGESLRTFNEKYAAPLVGRRSIVAIVSDGFDTGDPALLSAEMQRLRSRARRVIWLNPLLGRMGYEPTSAGISAALPWVDLLAPAHNLESLLALEPELVRL
jgi:uncharacterized protein with von Willebrand factor type A (vWA) domain